MALVDWGARLQSEANRGEIPLSVRCYRSVRTLYATRAGIFSTEGSRIAGGRYNLPAFGAIYLSLDPATTMHEISHYAGIAAAGFRPRVTVCIEVLLCHVLRLTDADTLSRLDLQTSDLCGDWVPDAADGSLSLTHSLAEAAYALGYEAILAPSARDSAGSNLVVYPDNLRPTSVLTIQHPDDLSG